MLSLKAQALCKTYGQEATAVEALKATNLVVERGECLAIVGPSGSGKSTLLHLLAGLDRPSGGRVEIDGTDIYQLDDEARAVFRRRRIGFVFQFFNLIPVLSAEENIVLPLLLDGRAADSQAIDELVDLLGLGDRRRHLPDALSGGEQQRVAIGRALVTRPALILADEPTGNLDTATAGQVLDLLIRSARRYEQAVVVVTHDPQVAARAGRVVTMRDGRIVSDEGGAR